MVTSADLDWTVQSRFPKAFPGILFRSLIAGGLNGRARDAQIVKPPVFIYSAFAVPFRLKNQVLGIFFSSFLVFSPFPKSPVPNHRVALPGA